MSTSPDPFKEILDKKRSRDEVEKKNAKPSAAALDLMDKLSPAEPKKEKSFLDNALETAGDFGVSGADEYAYGYGSKVLPYIMPIDEKDIPSKQNEFEERLKLAKERSPVASTIGQLGGFVASPVTRLLGAGLGGESKLAKMLADTGSLSKSASLRALAKTLGFTLPAIEGSAMVAAHEGKHTPIEIAGGGALNKAISISPKLAGGALVGSTIADVAGDKYAPNTGKLPAIIGGILGALTGKGSSVTLNAINRRRDPELLKKPLEFLENKYEEIGSKVPPEARGPDRSYAVPDWKMQSEKVRGIRKGIEDLQIKGMEDLPVTSKEAYQKASDYLGDMRHESFNDIKDQPEKMDKLLLSIKAINESRGNNQDPRKTLDNFMAQRKAANDNAGYDPANDTLSDIIIGKIRQTPIRHLRAFNNVFSETRNMKELNPDAIPNDIIDLYGKSLIAEEDVDSGRLNKWLREADKAGEETPAYTRLFDPQKPWQKLSNEQAQRMTDEGRTVVFGPQEQTPSPPQTKSDMLKTLLGGISEGKGKEKAVNKNEQEISTLMKRLYDMREGKRQLGMNRNEPSIIPYAIKDFIDRQSPLRMGEVTKVFDLFNSGKAEVMDKNLKYHARNYAKGAAIENMPPEMRPQILRLKELSARTDAVGEFSRQMLKQVELGNVDDFVRGMYMARQDNELRKFVQ